jgi:hypothetical protein
VTGRLASAIVISDPKIDISNEGNDMVADACLILYGNSVFLAGIKAELEHQVALELITIETGSPDVANLIRDNNPRAVLFDLSAEQPGFAITVLRERPGLLLIGVDPSSDELLILSSYPQQALSMSDLVEVIRRQDPNSESA